MIANVEKKITELLSFSVKTIFNFQSSALSVREKEKLFELKTDSLIKAVFKKKFKLMNRQ